VRGDLDVERHDLDPADSGRVTDVAPGPVDGVRRGARRDRAVRRVRRRRRRVVHRCRAGGHVDVGRHAVGTDHRLRARRARQRTRPCMAYNTDRKVVVLYGGQSSSGISDVWEWDGTVWTSKSSQTVPPARDNCAMAYDEARHVSVMFGGFGLSGGAGDTWTWD